VIKSVYAGVIVKDLEAARTWYEQILARPADATPMDGLLEWHFTEPGWLQVVSIAKVREVQRLPNWGAAGSSSLALVVDSIETHLALASAVGSLPVTRYSSDNFKTASISDPCGNLITFVEHLSGPR
jgi:hypothetical protein